MAKDGRLELDEDEIEMLNENMGIKKADRKSKKPTTTRVGMLISSSDEEDGASAARDEEPKKRKRVDLKSLFDEDEEEAVAQSEDEDLSDFIEDDDEDAESRKSGKAAASKSKPEKKTSTEGGDEEEKGSVLQYFRSRLPGVRMTPAGIRTLLEIFGRVLPYTEAAEDMVNKDEGGKGKDAVGPSKEDMEVERVKKIVEFNGPERQFQQPMDSAGAGSEATFAAWRLTESQPEEERKSFGTVYSRILPVTKAMRTGLEAPYLATYRKELGVFDMSELWSISGSGETWRGIELKMRDAKESLKSHDRIITERDGAAAAASLREFAEQWETRGMTYGFEGDEAAWMAVPQSILDFCASRKRLVTPDARAVQDVLAQCTVPIHAFTRKVEALTSGASMSGIAPMSPTLPMTGHGPAPAIRAKLIAHGATELASWPPLQIAIRSMLCSKIASGADLDSIVKELLYRIAPAWTAMSVAGDEESWEGVRMAMLRDALRQHIAPRVKRDHDRITAARLYERQARECVQPFKGAIMRPPICGTDESASTTLACIYVQDTTAHVVVAKFSSNPRYSITGGGTYSLDSMLIGSGVDQAASPLPADLLSAIRSARRVTVCGRTPLARLILDSVDAPMAVQYIADDTARWWAMSSGEAPKFAAALPGGTVSQGQAIALGALSEWTDPLGQWALLAQSDTQLDAVLGRSLLLPASATSELLRGGKAAKDTLFKAIRQTIMEAVCSRGTTVSNAGMLPWIPGLGPHKAAALLKAIPHSRAELSKCVPSLVYTNCAGFLKFTSKSNGEEDGGHSDEVTVASILDSTKIHPETYSLAAKMATDALLDVPLDPSELLTNPLVAALTARITRGGESGRLDELALEEYAAELARQGSPYGLPTLYLIREELQSVDQVATGAAAAGATTGAMRGLPLDESVRYMFDVRDVKALPADDSTLRVLVLAPAGAPSSSSSYQRGSPASSSSTPQTTANLPLPVRVAHRALNTTRSSLFWGVPVKSTTSSTAPLTNANIPVMIDSRHDSAVRPGAQVTVRLSHGAMNSMQRYMAIQADFISSASTPATPTVAASPSKSRPDSNHRSSSSSNNAAADIPSSVRRHRLFRDVPRSQAEAELSRKSFVGDALVRPSGSNPGHCVLTWLMDSSPVFQHVEVALRRSPSTPSGYSFLVEGDVYDDLDEIVARYVEPTVSYLQEIRSSPKFIPTGSEDETEARRQAEHSLNSILADDPQRIPYGIWLSRARPGTAYLSCLLRSASGARSDCLHERVRVGPQGLLMRKLDSAASSSSSSRPAEVRYESLESLFAAFKGIITSIISGKK